MIDIATLNHVYKLDIEKAYDYVNWNFLLSILENMNFGRKSIGYIKWCISSTRVLVIINDSLIGFFQSFRGLKQGYHLSSYLFVAAMEALSCLLKRVRGGTYLTGIKVREEVVKGRRCLICCLQVTLLLFVRLSKLKWFI